MAKSEAAKSLQRFVRQEYWNGLSAGEVVRVALSGARDEYEQRRHLGRGRPRGRAGARPGTGSGCRRRFG